MGAPRRSIRVTREVLRQLSPTGRRAYKQEMRRRQRKRARQEVARLADEEREERDRT